MRIIVEILRSKTGMSIAHSLVRDGKMLDREASADARVLNCWRECVPRRLWYTHWIGTSFNDRWNAILSKVGYVKLDQFHRPDGTKMEKILADDQ
jgi:hypothetical protein